MEHGIPHRYPRLSALFARPQFRMIGIERSHGKPRFSLGGSENSEQQTHAKLSIAALSQPAGRGREGRSLRRPFSTNPRILRLHLALLVGLARGSRVMSFPGRL